MPADTEELVVRISVVDDGSVDKIKQIQEALGKFPGVQTPEHFKRIKDESKGMFDTFLKGFEAINQGPAGMAKFAESMGPAIAGAAELAAGVTAFAGATVLAYKEMSEFSERMVELGNISKQTGVAVGDVQNILAQFASQGVQGGAAALQGMASSMENLSRVNSQLYRGLMVSAGQFRPAMQGFLESLAGADSAEQRINRIWQAAQNVQRNTFAEMRARGWSEEAAREAAAQRAARFGAELGQPNILQMRHPLRESTALEKQNLEAWNRAGQEFFETTVSIGQEWEKIKASVLGVITPEATEVLKGLLSAFQDVASVLETVAHAIRAAWNAIPDSIKGAISGAARGLGHGMLQGPVGMTEGLVTGAIQGALHPGQGGATTGPAAGLTRGGHALGIPGRQHGGAITETGQYTLHAGEMVASAGETSQAMHDLTASIRELNTTMRGLVGGFGSGGRLGFAGGSAGGAGGDGGSSGGGGVAPHYMSLGGALGMGGLGGGGGGAVAGGGGSSGGGGATGSWGGGGGGGGDGTTGGTFSDSSGPAAGALSANLAKDRARYADELSKNPGLREKILRIAANEQGSNPKGVQAVLESMMNRASVRGTSLAQQARWHESEHGYYQQGSMGRGALENPHSKAILDQALKNTLGGSNLANYATDNSSGGLAAREEASGKFLTRAKYTGETFSRPGSAEPALGRKWQSWQQQVSSGDTVAEGSQTPTSTQPSVEQEHPVGKSAESQHGTAQAQPDTGSSSAGVPHSVLDAAKHVALTTGGNAEAVQKFMASQGIHKQGQWCGEFAAAVVKSAGLQPPPGYQVASNWRKFGTADTGPRVGDIAVRKGAATGSTGSHVAIVSSVQGNRVTLEGGNQRAGLFTTVSAGSYDYRTPPGGAGGAAFGAADTGAGGGGGGGDGGGGSGGVAMGGGGGTAMGGGGVGGMMGGGPFGGILGMLLGRLPFGGLLKGLLGGFMGGGGGAGGGLGGLLGGLMGGHAGGAGLGAMLGGSTGTGMTGMGGGSGLGIFGALERGGLDRMMGGELTHKVNGQAN